MKGLKKQRRIQIIAAAVVALALATWLIGTALKDGINFFRSPTEVVEEPPAANEVFRLGGMVVEGSIIPGSGAAFSFELTDFNEVVPVNYLGTKIKPDLFGEGQGAIAVGKYINGVFEATEILAKHDETYMPKEISDSLQEQKSDEDPNG